MAGRRTLLAWTGLIGTALLAPVVLWLSIQADDAPKLHCEQSAFDFGDVAADAIVEHEFVLRNVSRQKLTDLKAIPGCGCISSELSRDATDPGGTLRAFVRLDVKTLRGPVEMKVFVGGDARAGRPVMLLLRGNVREVLGAM